MTNKAHPAVYLKFACGPILAGNPLITRSDLRVDLRPDGSCAHASWIYNVDGTAVQVTFAEHGMESGYAWWHPSLGTNRLLIEDLR
jgi:hypothetical protein